MNLNPGLDCTKRNVPLVNVDAYPWKVDGIYASSS